MNRKKYREYIHFINNILTQEDFYAEYVSRINEGRNNFKVTQTYQAKEFDMLWIEAIEESLISLDTIVRNPRKFIAIEEDIVDISLAKTISVESVKHLAQHTNMIASVSKDGDVTPNKILNTSKEESYEIYENRFIYTLLRKLNEFITRRYALVKQTYATNDKLQINVESDFSLGNTRMSYNIECIANMSLDEALELNADNLTAVEKIARINRIVNDFLGSAFAKQMVGSAPVRPPIQPTNVIRKNTDFKQAVKLWNFIERYQDVGITIDKVSESKDMSLNLSEQYVNIIYLNTILLQSIMASKDSSSSTLLDDEFEKGKDDKGTFEKDFSPDDFPLLKVEFYETQKVFSKNPFAKDISQEDTRKINEGIDRVLRQYNINKTKEDSAARARLIALQKKAEEAAILRAQKEAELELERIERKRIADEKARERAEKAAEKERRRKLKQEAKLKEEEERQKKLREEAEKAALYQAELAREQRIIAEKAAEEERAARIREEIERERLDRELKAQQEAMEKERIELEKQAAIKKAQVESEEINAELMAELSKKEIASIRAMQDDTNLKILSLKSEILKNKRQLEESYLKSIQIKKKLELKPITHLDSLSLNKHQDKNNPKKTQTNNNKLIDINSDKTITFNLLINNVLKDIVELDVFLGEDN